MTIVGMLDCTDSVGVMRGCRSKRSLSSWVRRRARKDILLRGARRNKDANAVVEHEGLTRGGDVLWFRKDEGIWPSLVMGIRRAGGNSAMKL